METSILPPSKKKKKSHVQKHNAKIITRIHIQELIYTEQ